MKHIKLLVLVLFMAATTQAQDIKKTIVKKWRYDTSAMKLQDNSMSDLPELDPGEEMEDVMDAMDNKRTGILDNTTLEFRKNGKIDYENEVVKRDADNKFKNNNDMFKQREKITKTGRWKVSDDGKVLMTVIDTKTTQYQIVSASDSKLVLKDEKGQIYVLIPSL